MLTASITERAPGRLAATSAVAALAALALHCKSQDVHQSAATPDVAQLADTALESTSTDSPEESDAEVGLADSGDGGLRCSVPATIPKKDCTDGWCRIEPGCFVMGAPREEHGAGRYSDRQVVVTLTRPFLIQQLELTQREWTAAGFPNPSGPTPDISDCIDPACPVGNVTFFDALAYANYRSRTASPTLPECYTLEGCTSAPGKELVCTSFRVTAPTIYQCRGYRLPTEAEWEYAARAGTTTAFYTGDIVDSGPLYDCVFDPNLDKIGWYCFNAGRITHRGGQKSPNAWGLFDMSGNVAEWVNDYFNGLGYGTGPLVDPQGPATYPTGVMRSGWASTPSIHQKSAARYELHHDLTGPGAGFRLARTILPALADASPP